MRFEKINYDAFKKDIIKHIFNGNGEHIDEEKIKNIYEQIKLPKRATSHSAGYDFISPVDIMITAYHAHFIPTGIKIKLDSDKMLQVVQRSSSAKNNYTLANSIGIIDSDYYSNPDNDGDIIIALRTIPSSSVIGRIDNEDLIGYTHFITYDIHAGDKIAQGIIVPFYTVEDDDAEGDRTGGFGSTGKTI